MSITKLMETSVGNVIDRRMQIFIYDLICLNEHTEDDIETIKAYEDPDDKEKHRVIDEMIKSCKLFKAKHVLLKQELPAVENVKICITRVPGQINPKVVLETMAQLEANLDSMAAASTDIDTI